MPIGNKDFIRRHIGEIESENVSDDDINKGIAYGLSEVYGYTFKDDWETELDHPLRGKVETTIEYYAAALMLDRFSGDGAKADRNRARAVENAKELKMQYDEYVLVNEGDSGGGGGSSGSKFSVAIAAYKTYPLNPDADVYRSPSIIPGD